LRALSQGDLKKRLAYSTVSQISYIVLGVSLGTPLATIGGIVHLVHQGLMKITLFFCAGNLAERLHVRRIDEVDGTGRTMPWTMVAFTLGAFGMIGVPPMAGFVTKWYLALGAMESAQYWVIGLLAVSSALNAAYFLPIVYRAWFKSPAGKAMAGRSTEDRRAAAPANAEPQAAPAYARDDIRWSLLSPPLVTAALALLAGLLAGSALSPLAWAEIIVTRQFGG
jgi:multicomponent Na+:H+ antiporter subunit D